MLEAQIVGSLFNLRCNLQQVKTADDPGNPVVAAYILRADYFNSSFMGGSKIEATLKTVARKMIIESLYHLSNLWSVKSLEPAMMTFQIQLLPPKNP